MDLEILLIYSAVSFFYIISPGPAIFLAVYNGATYGIKPVAAAALGNIIGLLFLSSASISGLSTILLASSTLFMGVKILGAVYLIYLGVRQFLVGKAVALSSDSGEAVAVRSLVSHFKEGLMIAVVNPKPILFFAALFPLFLDTAQPIALQFVVMTLIFMCFSFLSLCTYGFIAKTARGFLSNTDSAKWFHRISGGLFIGMGISVFQIKSTS